MKNKYVFVAALLLCILIVSMGLTTLYIKNSDKMDADEDGILIVTSFYPMYIATENIIDGAEGVTLQNLSEPKTGCLHDFQLTPEDMRLLSEADVFVINGGGIENFMEDVAASYPDLQVIEACENIQLMELEEEHEVHDHSTEHDEHHHEESANAHAWMSVAAYRGQVETIAGHLMEIDPEHATVYQANAKDYDNKLEEICKQQTGLKERLSGQSVILFHEAYAYVAEELGLSVCYLMDLDEERAVSAGEVAEVLEAIEEHQVSLVFAEELYGSDMGNTVERESDVKVLYLDTLNRGTYEKDSYLIGMQKNLEVIEAWIAEGETNAKNN